MRLSAEALEAVCKGANLSEPLRRVLLLRYVEELPDVEIAAREDISPTTVRTRIARAKQKIQHVQFRIGCAEYIDILLRTSNLEIEARSLAEAAHDSGDEEDFARVLWSLIKKRNTSPATPQYGLVWSDGVNSLAEEGAVHAASLTFEDVLDVVRRRRRSDWPRFGP
jgi:hypothetical protein